MIGRDFRRGVGESARLGFGRDVAGSSPEDRKTFFSFLAFLGFSIMIARFPIQKRSPSQETSCIKTPSASTGLSSHHHPHQLTSLHHYHYKSTLLFSL